MHDGLEVPQHSRTKFLTEEEERGLGQRIAKGDQKALDKLIFAHKPMAKRMAYEYLRSLPRLVQERTRLEDLEQAAHEGFLRAVRNFEPDKGRFSTHAEPWVREMMRTAVYDEEPVFIPRQDRKHRGSVARAQKVFTNKHGRLPSISELKEGIDLNEEQIRRALSEPPTTVSVLASATEDDNGVSIFEKLLEGSSPPIGDLARDAQDELLEARQAFKKIFLDAKRTLKNEESFRTFCAIFGTEEDDQEKKLVTTAAELGISRQALNERWKLIRKKLGYGEDYDHAKNPIFVIREKIQNLKELLDSISVVSGSEA